MAHNLTNVLSHSSGGQSPQRVLLGRNEDVGRVAFFLEALQENPFFALSCFGWLWQSFVWECGCSTPISASVVTLHPPLCISSSVFSVFSLPFFYEDTCHCFHGSPGKSRKNSSQDLLITSAKTLSPNKVNIHRFQRLEQGRTFFGDYYSTHCDLLERYVKIIYSDGRFLLLLLPTFASYILQPWY